MIESGMIFSLGLMTAFLLMLIIAPRIHERAERITTKNLLAATPLSLAEIRANKDQMRAQFAMSMRRLELTVEETKAKAACQLAEIGRKIAENNRLKVELSKKTTLILALEARGQVRKSITRRVVKVLLFVFIRSTRRSHRLLSPRQSRSHTQLVTTKMEAA